ncbi:beta-hexosaminidase [Cutibacterium acnes JCM 18916]|nr:beta-hexosaminidase [Cutibacterium acnes JCM 18916]
MARQGWRVAMWADIVNSHPEALDIIPDEVLLIPWTYESPAMEAKFADTEGYEIRSDAGFASTARLVANAGRPFVNAPGTGAWNTFTGRLSNAVGNIVDAVITDHSLGGKGVLLTVGETADIMRDSSSLSFLLSSLASRWRIRSMPKG